MFKSLLQKIKNLPRLRLLIIALVIWQYISILGIAILNWDKNLIWLNFFVLAIFIIFAPCFESLLLNILSIPFFVVLPHTTSDTLSMWRGLFALLFLVWLLRENKFQFNKINFLPWDRFLGYFVVLALLATVCFAPDKTLGLSRFIFFLNIYLFYLVLINVVKSKQQVLDIIRSLLWALTIIVTLGFTQLFATFFTSLDVFWVFWASNVTKVYYGNFLSQTSLYSNSWFSYNGARQLRMFSIMPDSQSFAYVCLMGLCLGTALTRNVFIKVKKWLWSGIRFAGLALILSGTRAVWVGMLLPFAAVLIGYFNNIQKKLAKKFIWPFAIILILFAISPLFNKALLYLHFGGKFQENFITRAKSIYDLSDNSNRGRLQIWQQDLSFAFRHPLGIGLGNFMSIFSERQEKTNFKELGNRVHKDFNLPIKYISAHNLYLQILVETGVAGLVAFGLFWLMVLYYLWNFIFSHELVSDFYVYFVAQAFLVVLWVLAASFFDITLLNDRVLTFLLIDLGLAGIVVQKYQKWNQE